MKNGKLKPYQYVDVENLRLDPQNPRIPDSVNRTKEDMLHYIANETSIEELMGSIAENGFFSGEPLIAYKTKKKDIYNVVEGNRRLAAVLLLHNPELIPKRKKIREISETSKNTPDELPVVIFDERDEVLEYLGYRHITGIKQWDSLAKAKYMHQLFSRIKRKVPQERYQEVAKSIGSRRDYVKKVLDSYALYKIMEDNDFYGIENLQDGDIDFSLIPTAIGQTNIQKFLSLKGDPIIDDSKISRKNLKDFALWVLKKDEEGQKRVRESRQLRKLAFIVSHEKALKEFKGGMPLEEAFKFTKGIEEDFRDRLNECEIALQSANANVANVDTDPYEEKVIRIFKQAKQLKQTVEGRS